uniref:Uncharacterized protein n=1 Tax=Trichuris muris TaxID=70415 RepID=A0A5S6QSP9_TRIMR
MSCSSELTFPSVSAKKVEPPPWLNDTPTTFERVVANFINFLQPSDLPLDKVIDADAKSGTVDIKGNVGWQTLLELVKGYELWIAVVALLPFLILLLSGIYFCCIAFGRCLCCMKRKPKEKSLTKPVLLLFFTGTIVSFAIFTWSSCNALNEVIKGMPDDLVNSVNYVPAFANAMKEVLERLLTSDFDLLMQHLKTKSLSTDCVLQEVAVGETQESLKDVLENFYRKHNETAKYQQELKKCVTNASLCANETDNVLTIVTRIKAVAESVAQQLVAMIEKVTEPLKSVRSMSDSLITSADVVKSISTTITKYRSLIEQYDSYRQLATKAYAVVIVAISFGLFSLSVLLLFFFGPKGGSCRPGVSEKCVRKYLAIFSCLAYLLAFLGSILFLVLFIIGANLHLVCRPFETMDTSHGSIATLSDFGNSFLKSALFSTDISSIASSINVENIIEGCRQRKTLFVILRLNTLDLPTKLVNMFDTFMQPQTEDKGKAVPKVKQPGSSAVHGDKQRFNSSLRSLSQNLSKLSPSHHSSNRQRRIAPLGFQSASGHKRVELKKQQTKRRSLENETAAMVPHWQRKGMFKREMRLRRSSRSLPVSNGSSELLQIQLDPAECTKSTDMLKGCLSLLQQIAFKSCAAGQYDKFTSQLQSLVDIGGTVMVLCTDGHARFTNTTKALLSKELLVFGKHVNKVFENDLLPCDIVIYSAGGIVNTVCWSVLRKLNCWTIATGVWCFLVIFVMCLSRSVRKMLNDDPDQK